MYSALYENTYCSMAANGGDLPDAGEPVTFCSSPPRSIRARGVGIPSPAKAKIEFARVVRAAGTNSLALLSELRDVDSPLAEVLLHPGILEVASLFADGCDTPGIEPAELEMLLRTVIYLDRLERFASE